MLNKIFNKRRLIQFFLGFAVYVSVSFFRIPLTYILIFSAITGIFLGKFFCRWMCPIGYIVESINTLIGNDARAAMSQYHKVGCPIAWIGGFFNKLSIFKIKIDPSSCINCGKCDDVCYISILNKDFSVYDKTKLDATDSYKCSKCMDCVTICPVNSIKLSTRDKK